MTPLAKHMESKGLNDMDLSFKSGVTPTAIFRLRKGQSLGRIATWRRLGVAMGIDYRRLLPEPSEGASRR